MAYLDENFLLHSPTARRLFHEVAKDQPIIDYHCHLSPKEIATNHRWSDISEIWLAGDHYKWRLMRANGIDEDFITGGASPREKFQAWAETVPYTLRNPIHHWTHIELQRYFGIDLLLSPATADEIWDRTNAKLAGADFSTHGLLKKFDVRVVGTTDDPADPLDDHLAIAASVLTTVVAPTFRPDKAFLVDRPDLLKPWLEKLESVSDIAILHLSDLLAALQKRHDDFHAAGARLSDHGLDRLPALQCTDEEAAMIFDRALFSKPVTPEKLIASFQNDPPDFAPGAGFLYNNSAYFLAGQVVAKVSGKPYATYLKETFFDPLGMKDTGVFVNASPPAGVPRGYSFAEGKASLSLDWDMSWAGGAGALYSTTADLLRWSDALFGGKVLKEASFKEMTTPVKLPEGVDGMNYGCGLAMSELRRLPCISHSGGLNGWSCDFLYFPQQHCTVIALTNSMPSAPGFEPGTIARNLAEKFLEEDIKKIPPLKEDPGVDRKSYPSLAGRYDYKNAVATVSVENDRLYAQLTGQPKHEIYPSAPDHFFWKVTDAQVEFLRDSKGVVTAARHTQGGNTFTAKRLEAEVKLTAAELDAILGKYQYGALGVLTVTRDGDAVFAQMTGQPKMPIFPKSATEFEWRAVKASVRFEKDKEGKVTKATHSQNGGRIEAKKIE